jgi:hypothetical protein
MTFAHRAANRAPPAPGLRAALPAVSAKLPRFRTAAGLVGCNAGERRALHAAGGGLREPDRRAGGP